VIVNYDYVGPHRYQYPEQQWSRVCEVNERLPEKAKQGLVYPRVFDMLANDPFSAMHSELTLATMRRYFTVDDYRPVGGAIAHPILSYNEKLFGFFTNLDEIIYSVLEADWDYLSERPESTLFAYWTARPNHAVLRNERLLARLSTEEEQREAAARQHGGRYYPPTSVEASVYPDDVGAVSAPQRRKLRRLRTAAQKLLRSIWRRR
jgi:hypothetical protein